MLRKLSCITYTSLLSEYHLSLVISYYYIFGYWTLCAHAR